MNSNSMLRCTMMMYVYGIYSVVVYDRRDYIILHYIAGAVCIYAYYRCRGYLYMLTNLFMNQETCKLVLVRSEL